MYFSIKCRYSDIYWKKQQQHKLHFIAVCCAAMLCWHGFCHVIKVDPRCAYEVLFRGNSTEFADAVPIAVPVSMRILPGTLDLTSRISVGDYNQDTKAE